MDVIESDDYGGWGLKLFFQIPGFLIPGPKFVIVFAFNKLLLLVSLTYSYLLHPFVFVFHLD